MGSYLFLNNMESRKIIIISSVPGSGNNNQLLGVERELGHADVERWEVVENYAEKASSLDFNGKIDFIAVHKNGLGALGEIENVLKDRADYNLLSHEYFPEIDQATRFLARLFIPSYNKIDKSKIGKTNIYLTYGVANNVTKNLALKNSELWLKDKSYDDCAIGVVIGGKYDNIDISKDDIIRLAGFSIKEANKNNCDIYYCYSHRTTSENKKHFSEVLASNGVKNSYLLTSNSGNNSLLTMFGIIASSPKSMLIITGDSINMTYEAAKFPEFIKPDQIYIALLENLGTIYKDSANMLNADGRVNLLDLRDNKITNAKNVNNLHGFNTEEFIANIIYE
jgi:hypothetical protein